MCVMLRAGVSCMCDGVYFGGGAPPGPLETVVRH